MRPTAALTSSEATREAIADPRVSAVYFLTAHHVHLQNALLAARHSKHILIEKPIARTIGESRQMIAAAGEAGVKLMVAENFRFLPTVNESLSIIQKGDIGELRLIEIHQEHYSATTGWRASAELRGGGELVDGGIHSIDLLLTIGGYPERLYAATPPRLFREPEGEDGIIVTAHMPQGCLGLINISTAAPVKDAKHTVTITGTKGQLSFSPYDDQMTLQRREGLSTVRLSRGGRGIREMVQEFRASILEDREPLMSGEEGLKDLRVVLAAYRSVEERREVSPMDIELEAPTLKEPRRRGTC